MKGIEPSAEVSEVADIQSIATSPENGNTQIRAQMAGAMGRDLSRVVAAWSQLSAPLRAAILAIVISASAVQEDES